MCGMAAALAQLAPDPGKSDTPKFWPFRATLLEKCDSPTFTWIRHFDSMLRRKAIDKFFQHDSFIPPGWGRPAIVDPDRVGGSFLCRFSLVCSYPFLPYLFLGGSLVFGSFRLRAASFRPRQCLPA